MALSVQKVLTKVFGSRNERLLKRYRRIVEQINSFEPKVQVMTDEQLRARTQELRAGVTGGLLRSGDVLPEAFAIIRESMDRHIGIREIFNPEQNFDPDKLDDAMLEAYDSVQRHMIATGESWQQVAIPREIYDAVRKLYPESRPPFRARPFDVQLIGGLVLYEGKIAEMATGEGKTFVAPLACFMRVLEGLHCHVVTVNDYLVRRDAMWLKPAFDNLGITVGYIQSEMEPGGASRREMYERDITYGTNSEFGFDYLRDNMKERADLQVQGPLDFAIVDEVDSILIDEARTPLIISGAAHDDAPKYRAADTVARKLIELHKPWAQAEKAVDAAKRAIKAAEGDEEKAREKDQKEKARQRRAEAEKQLEEAEARKAGLTQYYEVELDKKSAHMTHDGIAAAQEAAGVGSFYVGANMEWPHLMEQSLRAHVVYEKDKDYVVERGPRGEMEVVIVDEYTGRKMTGRQWSDGLHQAVEAKERVPIKTETQTLATITLQNFFKLYKALAGMTGTAQTEAEEFAKIYKLEVVTIPTNRPVIREDGEDRVYRTEEEKWTAILEEIKEVSDKGRPVLVGTTSVEKSEMLSTLLKRKYGIEHEVLNAKYHEREAQIVAVAGQQHKNAHGETVGNVTIATNMAGRGTDIKLSPEAHAAGGLHVIGTERHTARRIDNQLRGRGGRQGDPGSSRFYVSLKDDLMAMFAGEWTIKVLGWLGMEEGMAIEDKRISKGILRAQKKVEERNFLSRKNLLEYDEVMDHQRTTFYGMRQQVLEGRDVDQVIWSMIGDAINDAVEKYITNDYVSTVIAEWARVNFEVNIDPGDLRGLTSINELESYIKDQARNEAVTNITATLGEFIGEDTEDRTAWDVKGLQSWAMSRFQVQLSLNQIRSMDAHELEEKLAASAIEQINARDAAGLAKYLVPHYAETELANWARDKFGIEIKPEEMILDERGGRVVRKPPAEIVDLIEGRARAAYARREIEYPVDHTLTFATSVQGASSIDNPYAADYLRAWVRAKFGVELSVAHVQGTSLRKLREELIGYQQEWMGDGRIDNAIDAIMRRGGNANERLVTEFNARFPIGLTVADLESRTQRGKSEASVGDRDGDGAVTPRDVMINAARQFLRRELTDLEQFVLIQIFDQSWKDHLYAMDQLKGGIGLQAFAERDPRVLYKKEGYRFFQEMMAGVRDKVTDLIFRARVVGQAQTRSAYHVTAATHADTGGYGVSENLRQTADQGVPAPAGGGGEMAASSEQPQGDGAKIKTIVRNQPKVGRNENCPCGSGKKYKKCCGAQAA
ncbi:MAG TPA: SEC-C metal-binding domain-containing protein [Tepidisphaeraceae bacterium]|nr:SEC-C metal-binding domain-containing protein [Tepidisphaeraceae bacterium]